MTPAWLEFLAELWWEENVAGASVPWSAVMHIDRQHRTQDMARFVRALEARGYRIVEERWR